MIANLCAALIVATSAIVAPKMASAGPLLLGPNEYIDFRLDVATELMLVPGQTGFMLARLTNLGNVDATFPVYDAANDVGGFAWKFFSEGLVLSGFSQTGGGPTGLVTSTEGLVDPLAFDPAKSFVFGHPASWFHLSSVTIAPSETLEFAIRSLTVSPSATHGTSFEYDVNNFLLTFCHTGTCGRWDSPGVGWDVQSTATVGAAFSNGAFQTVPLTLAGTAVPEPGSSLILAAIGFAAMFVTRLRC